MKDTEENVEAVEENVESQMQEVDNSVDKMDADVDKAMEAAETEEIVDKQEEVVEKEAECVENTVENVEELVEKTMETDVLEGNSVETVDNSVETVDTFVDEATEADEGVAKEASKKKHAWMLVLFLLVLVGIGAYSYFGGEDSRPIFYAKDNALYIADESGAATLLHEGIGEDAGYHYYYGAWGAMSADESDMGYYLANVDEMGVGDLYMQDLGKSSDAIKVGENVFEFRLNEVGDVCMYLTLSAEMDMSVYVAKNGVSQLVTDSLYVKEDAFALSSDGSYVMFQETDGENISLCVMDVATLEVTELADKSIMFFVAEESDAAYHIASEDGINVLYEYQYGVGEVEIAQNVYFFNVLSDESSVLYATLPMENIACADLIVDDVENLSDFDADRQEIIISLREQLVTALDISPLLQNAFVWKDGASIAFDRQIISLAPVSGDGNFFFAYGVEEFEKIPLSEINDLSEVMSLYYTELAYGAKEVFVANDAGDIYDLETAGEIPTAMMVSGDGTQVAYLLTTASGNALVLEVLGEAGSAVEVAENVSTFAFVGDKHTLVYYNNYVDGVGDLYAYENGTQTLLDASVLGVSFAEGEEPVTYLANPDTTGNAELKTYDGTKTTLLAEDVFSFQTRDENSIVYMQGYDIETSRGSIYHYFNGKALLLADEATAIYMY